MGQKLYDHTKHEMLLSKNQKIIRMSLKYIALKNLKWPNLQCILSDQFEHIVWAQKTFK